MSTDHLDPFERPTSRLHRGRRMRAPEVEMTERPQRCGLWTLLPMALAAGCMVELGTVGDVEPVEEELGSWSDHLHHASLGEPIPMTAPEGLYVVGHFDPARATILYVHGWVPHAEAPIAPNLEGWQGAGFNTAFMRWHVAATDSAAGCPGGGGLFGIPNTPCNAEARVFGARGNQPAANHLRRFRATKPLDTSSITGSEKVA